MARTMEDKKAALLARKAAIKADDPRLSPKAATLLKAKDKAAKKEKAKAKAERKARKPKPKWYKLDLSGLPGLADFAKSCNSNGIKAITLEADTKFRPEYVEHATGLALLGHDYKDMAIFFGVPDHTILQWIATEPDFANAIKRGSTLADMGVAVAFRKRAIGFTQETQGPVMVDRNGDVLYDPETGKPVRQMIVQYFPPSEAACAKWLSSRQRKVWGDVTKVESTVTATVQTATEARRQLADIFNAPADQPPEKK